MSVPCKIIVDGAGVWKEYQLEFEPRIGDEIQFPDDEDGSRVVKVVSVLHYARDLYGNTIPDCRYFCHTVGSR